MTTYINLKDFFDLLSIPSIGADPNYNAATLKCAEWIRTYLEKIGFQVELWEGFGHPTLFAKADVDPAKKTLLIYNHYDVQPVDPIEQWENPPFEPVLKDGNIYARGAQDNKGQLFYVLSALKFIKERDGKFPLNIKLCIEGEEEFGSASLQKALKVKKGALKSDYLAIVDLGIPAKDTPALTLGTRGMVTMEMEVCGSKFDLHSGCHGGVAYNPLHALIKILNSVRNEKGEITIDGFYDDVEPFSKEATKEISLQFDPKQYESNFGALATGGEQKFSPAERLYLRPTLEINGICGGYAGPGHKSVIPAKASAKISCRLVPHQNPQNIAHLVKDFLEKKAPPGIQVHVKIFPGGGEAARISSSSEAVLAFSQAFAEVYGKNCGYILEGATISIIPELIQASGAQTVLLGLGLTTDQIHAPNEHFSLDRLEKGAKIMVRGIELLGEKT